MNLRIYLDTSVYNRPFDDQSQPRIWLESLAFSLILESIEHGDLDLIASAVIQYETSRNPYEIRRRWIHSVIALAVENRPVNEAIRRRANALEISGIKPLDALHVAAAEAAQADYFVTCDDRLIKRYRALAPTALVVCEPTVLIQQLSPYEEE
ncbi:MAG: PIN domain-containing protein [Caldilineaceae bacterium]